MKLYILLFLSGFLNDMLLSSFYINASRGEAAICVLFAAFQQVLAIFQAYHSFSGCKPGSREQLYRWMATGLGYCLAAWVTVTFWS